MTRILLRSLNAPGLILIALFGIVLQTALFRSWPLNYLQPDIVLIVVIWCALKRDFTEGGILTLILAEICEIHSAAPQGLFLICYMLIYLLIRLADWLLVIPNLFTIVMLTLFASAFWKLSSLGVLHFLGISANQWRHTLALLFPGAVVEGLVSIWMYRWLDKFDLLTYKSALADNALEEGM